MSELEAVAALKAQRWPHGIRCPHCTSAEYYDLHPRPESRCPCRVGAMKCKKCRKQFSVLSGTPLHRCLLPFAKIVQAIELIYSGKIGRSGRYSSYALSRELYITQKSAWLLIRRITKTQSRWKRSGPNSPNYMVNSTKTRVLQAVIEGCWTAKDIDERLGITGSSGYLSALCSDGAIRKTGEVSLTWEEAPNNIYTPVGERARKARNYKSEKYQNYKENIWPFKQAKRKLTEIKHWLRNQSPSMSQNGALSPGRTLRTS